MSKGRARDMKGNFMWAVQQISQGRTVKRKGKRVIQYFDLQNNCISEDNIGYDYKRFKAARFDLEDYIATDWEIYNYEAIYNEEPPNLEKLNKENNMENRCKNCGGEIRKEAPIKKDNTLSNKIFLKGNTFQSKLLKSDLMLALQNLKSFIESFDDYDNKFSNVNTITKSKVKRKAKELFGARLW